MGQTTTPTTTLTTTTDTPGQPDKANDADVTEGFMRFKCSPESLK